MSEYTLPLLVPVARDALNRTCIFGFHLFDITSIQNILYSKFFSDELFEANFKEVKLQLKQFEKRSSMILFSPPEKNRGAKSTQRLEDFHHTAKILGKK